MKARLVPIGVITAALAVSLALLLLAAREGLERAPRCDQAGADLPLGLDPEAVGWLALGGAGGLLGVAMGGGASLPAALDPALRERARFALDALQELRASPIGAPLADQVAVHVGKLALDWRALGACLPDDVAWS